MPGQTEAAQVVIVLSSISAMIMDIWTRKIWNELTFGLVLSALIYYATHLGFEGFLKSIIGILCGFGLYLPLYIFKVVGAGDVKLLMGLGAWGGMQFIAHTGITGILWAGVFSFVYLVFRGQFFPFLRRMEAFLLPLFVKDLKFSPPSFDTDSKLPFGIPLALSAIGSLSLVKF